jgi:hypothetical protein
MLLAAPRRSQVDHQGALCSALQLHQFPSTSIYAPYGTLVARHTAAAGWSARAVIDFIDKLKRL